jgi:hypothetical protein
MKSKSVVRNYYVVPSCLLLLNLCVELVSYKAKRFDDPYVRTAAIIAMVLFGGSLVGFVVAPALSRFVGGLHRSSREAGRVMELLFMCALGAVIFWLYYRIYVLGPESVLPVEWHNPHFLP